MDIIVHQIHTLSTQNQADLKKLKDFLRHEAETLKANASSIDQALQTLDPVQNTLGVVFLLAAQFNANAVANVRATFAFICHFLQVADELQAKKASLPLNIVCKHFAQMAIESGQTAMLKSLLPLRSALEKLRENPETLTSVHAEFIRVCLKAKVYDLATDVLDQPIFDISVTGGNSSNSSASAGQLTPQGFLSYFYYGALVRIGTREYLKAIQMLLVVLTCPTSCLSAIQADAYKKYVLVSLKVHGEVKPLPVYSSHILQSYAKSSGHYVQELVEAVKTSDTAAAQRLLTDKRTQIEADQNIGLVKQVISSMQRHKIKLLTKTYLTLSLAEIAVEVGMEATQIAEAEALVFNMICEDEIKASIDQTTGNVAFEDDDAELDEAMMQKLQGKLAKILQLSQRISAFEQEVVTSEAYIRKTNVLEGDRSAAAAATVGGYDFMDM
mmetsp:Transcript_23598/g.42642  ORF Transcript_23598/g.42642 Transcript_23598/m.42642 type:complete len:442 (-) Transcript_23598:74-1399(-)